MDLGYGKQEIKDGNGFSNLKDWVYGHRGVRGATIPGKNAEFGVRLPELGMILSIQVEVPN